MTSEPSTRTVDRAMALVAAVCDGDGVSIAAAAREAELHRSTALRLMRSLESTGFLIRDQHGDFRPGPRLIQLGAKAFSRESLIALSARPMTQVVDETGESVYLSIPGHGKSAVYVAIHEGTYSVRHTNWVGRAVPLEGSAVGLVFAGDVPPAGYVVLQNTIEEDVTAIVAPIRVGPRVVGAMSTLVPTYRLDQDKQEACGESLVRATAEVAEKLGQDDS